MIWNANPFGETPELYGMALEKPCSSCNTLIAHVAKILARQGKEPYHVRYNHFQRIW